jgi:hypothetical protein
VLEDNTSQLKSWCTNSSAWSGATQAQLAPLQKAALGAALRDHTKSSGLAKHASCWPRTLRVQALHVLLRAPPSCAHTAMTSPSLGAAEVLLSALLTASLDVQVRRCCCLHAWVSVTGIMRVALLAASGRCDFGMVSRSF